MGFIEEVETSSPANIEKPNYPPEVQAEYILESISKIGQKAFLCINTHASGEPLIVPIEVEDFRSDTPEIFLKALNLHQDSLEGVWFPDERFDVYRAFGVFIPNTYSYIVQTKLQYHGLFSIPEHQQYLDYVEVPAYIKLL